MVTSWFLSIDSNRVASQSSRVRANRVCLDRDSGRCRGTEPQFLSHAHIVQEMSAVSGNLQIENERLLNRPPTLIVHARGERASTHPGGADCKREDS